MNPDFAQPDVLDGNRLFFTVKERQALDSELGLDLEQPSVSAESMEPELRANGSVPDSEGVSQSGLRASIRFDGYLKTAGQIVLWINGLPHQSHRVGDSKIRFALTAAGKLQLALSPAGVVHVIAPGETLRVYNDFTTERVRQ